MTRTDWSPSESIGHLRPYRIIDWLALASTVAVGALILARLLAACHYGFDLTDEGSLLNWINAPFPVRDRQFGYFYHPLWVLVGKDVARLRQANVLITMGLAFALSLLVLRGAGAGGVSGPLAGVARWSGLAFALSTVTGVAFARFLTPGYNSLALQALLVAAIGLWMAEGSFSRTSISGWILLGMGGWLAFMGKPTTAAGLAVLALAYVILAKAARMALLGLAAGVAVLLLVGFVLLVDGSPIVFIARLEEAVGDLVCMDAGQTHWLRIDIFGLTRNEWHIMVLVSTAVALGTMASVFGGRSGGETRWRSVVQWVGSLGWLGLVVAAMAVSVASWCDLTTWRNAGPFRDVTLAGVCLGAACGVLAVRRGNLRTGLDQRAWCNAGLFLLAPYAFALGTNANYWRSMQMAGLFWVCVGIVFLARLPDAVGRWRACVLATIVSQAITMNSIVVGFEHPYRQPGPLFQNRTVVNLGPGGSAVRMSNEFAEYIGNLRAVAVENGYTPGMPVLDLTGHSPGALFALGAKPVGTAWLSGGYPGSVATAKRVLDRVPADELRRAWILSEPEGPGPLPGNLLERYGLSLGADYGLVAIIFSPEGAGMASDMMQNLYKPGAVSRVELHSIADVAFPIALPPVPTACERIAGDHGMAQGWVNVGSRGAVSVQGIEDQPGVMRLVAGEAGPEHGESCRHCLLLQPAATGDRGLSVVPEAQIVEFECDLRSTAPTAPGKLLLRLDRHTESGWTYAVSDRWIEPGERWTSHRVRVHLGGKVHGVRPILEWRPFAEGAALELRNPHLRWIKIISSAPRS